MTKNKNRIVCRNFEAMSDNPKWFNVLCATIDAVLIMLSIPILLFVGCIHFIGSSLSELMTNIITDYEND